VLLWGGLMILEQVDHVTRREEVKKALGERRTDGGNGNNQHGSNPVTVSGLQTTADLAAAI
jgi:hypothetical protein